MSCRIDANEFVVHGPVQFVPPSYEIQRPFFVPGGDDVRVVRVDAHLADRVVLRELSRRLGVGRAEDVGAERRPVRAAVGRLEDPLAAHRERAVVEVAGAGVDDVVVVRVDRQRVDADRRDERIVGRHAPRRRVAAAVRRLPDAAADARRVRDDAAVRRRRRIDDDRVDATRRPRVVEAAAAAGHALRRRSERDRVGRVQHNVSLRERGGFNGLSGRIGALRRSALDALVLRRSAAEPGRVVVTGRVRDPVAPVRLEQADGIGLAVRRCRVARRCGALVQHRGPAGQTDADGHGRDEQDDCGRPPEQRLHRDVLLSCPRGRGSAAPRYPLTERREASRGS